MSALAASPHRVRTCGACGEKFRSARGLCPKCGAFDADDGTTAGRDEWPVHQPDAPEAPIPGRHWYSGCNPDRPRVRPDGVCEDCGRYACPECGREACPDHPAADPLAAVSEYGSNLPWATPSARVEARGYATRGWWTAVWEILSTEANINAACGNQRKADLLTACAERAFQKGARE